MSDGRVDVSLFVTALELACVGSTDVLTERATGPVDVQTSY